MAKMKLSDITGRKETKAELRNRCKRYEAALGEILNDRKNVSQALLVSRLQGLPYQDMLEVVIEEMERVAKKALDG